MEVSDADREAAARDCLKTARELRQSSNGDCSQIQQALFWEDKAFEHIRATQAAELDALRGEVERLKQETAEESPYCQLCGSCGDAYCGCTHKCKYPDGEVVALKDTIAQLRDRVAGLEEGAEKIVSAVVGSNADLAKDTGSTYRICCEAARVAHYKFVAARALLTQNEVG